MRKTREWRFFLPSILLLLAASAGLPPELPAQTLPAVVFRAVDLSPTREYGEYQFILTGMLQAEVANSGFGVLPEGKWDQVREKRGYQDVDLLEGSKALEVAAEAGARLAVTGFYRVENRQFVLEIKCYDVEARAFIQGVLKTGRLTLAMYNLLDGAVKELMPKVRLVGKPPPPPGPVIAEMVTLRSEDEGTEILLAGSQTVGTIVDGSLLMPPIPFPVGSAITVEKRKEGYHPSREALMLDTPVQEFRLKPLHPKTRWGTEFNWTYGQVLGFGVAQRYYLKPDASYARRRAVQLRADQLQRKPPPVPPRPAPAVRGLPVHRAGRAVPPGLVQRGRHDPHLVHDPGPGAVRRLVPEPDQRLPGAELPPLAGVPARGRKVRAGLGTQPAGAGNAELTQGPPPITMGFMWKW